MTTANLSVDLNTKKAKVSLQALKNDLKNELRGVVISVNTESLVKSVSSALSSRTFKVNLDSAQLSRDAVGALRSAFSQSYQVTLDKSSLTGQVREAIKAGSTGASTGLAPSVVAAPSSFTSGGPDLKTYIQQILTPAVDELAKSAVAVGGVARQIGASGGAGRLSAKMSQSMTDESGARISVSKPLANPELIEARIKGAFQADKIEDEKLKLQNLITRSSSKLDPRLVLGLPSRDEMKTASAQIRAQMEEAANEATNLSNWKKRSAPKLDPRLVLGLPSRDEMRTASAQIRAQMEEDVASVTRAMKQAQSRAQFEAPDNLTAKGKRAFAAKALIDQFGQERASGFLNNDGLIKAASNLDAYTKKADSAHPVQARINQAMRDGHAAARGLASGLNMIWLTWGNLGPLLAGAAASNAFVKSIRIGSEVGQELATIRFLGGESSSEIAKLNAALLDTRTNGQFGPREAASALKTLSLAGLDAKQQLQALPSVMQFSTTGQVALEKGAETLVSIATAYGYSARDFNVVGDIVTKAAASSMASVDSMSESFKTASVVAQQYKVSLTDTAQTLALLSQIGIKGTAAGTAMRQMYSELIGSSKKARDILDKTLKIDVVDMDTGGLRSIAQIIPEIAASLEKFDPKAQLRILQEMGNERGTKALVANLTAYRQVLKDTGATAQTELARMQQMMAEAPGFMAQASIGMALTSQNQMKSVSAAFESSLVRAFQAIEPSLLVVSTRLKETFNSTEFQGGVRSLVVAIGEFTVFLIEHASTIGNVLKMYLAWKAATVGFAVFQAIGTGVSFLSAQVGLLATRMATAAPAAGLLSTAIGVMPAVATAASAAMVRLQLAMGWIGVIGAAIGGAAALWMMYKDASVDASTSTGKAAQASAIATEAALDAEIAKLEESIRLRKGSTEEAIRAQEQQTFIGLENISVKYEEARATLKAAHAQNLLNEAKLKDKIGNTPFAQTAQGSRALDQAANTSAASRDSLASSYLGEYEAREKLEEKLRKFRSLANENAAGATAAAANRFKSNFGTQKFETPDRDAQAAAQRLKNAQLNSLLKEQTDATNAVRQEFKFRKELEDVTYSSDRFGPMLAAALAEQRQIVETNRLIKLETDQVQALQNAKKRFSGDASHIERIESEIESRNANVSMMKAQLEQDKKMSAARSANKVLKDDAEQTSVLRTVDDFGLKQQEKERASYSKKQVDPAAAAQMRAELEVMEQFREVASKKELEINQLLEGRIALQELDEEVRDSLLKKQDEQIQKSRDELRAIREKVALTARASGSVARSEYESSQTAASGWTKFWQEYEAKATSSAQMVEGVMKTSTEGMSQGLNNFFTTGKFGWRNFVNSIIAEVTRMMIQKGMMMLFKGMMGGGLGGGSSVADGGNFFYSANGNIMTDSGPMRLNKFANGGVAYSPMMSIFGEGRTPEAYVPLPDGRTIPVTMSGAGGAGSQPSATIHQTTNIHIDSRSDSAQVHQIASRAASSANKEMLQMLKDNGLLTR